MDLEHAHLDEREQTGQVIDDYGVVVADCDPADRLGKSLADLPLVEGLPRQPERAAHEAQRTFDDVREDPPRDRVVVLGDVALGDPIVGIDRARRIGDPHPPHPGIVG